MQCFLIAYAVLSAVAAGLPAAVPNAHAAAHTFGGSTLAELDGDGNGVEDLLDAWRRREVDWTVLRSVAVAANRHTIAAEEGRRPYPPGPETGPWATGKLRLLCLGWRPADLAPARSAAKAAGGFCQVLGSLKSFGGVTALAVDPAGLAAVLDALPAERRPGTILLDRDGRPALDDSRAQIGAQITAAAPWGLGDDWTGSVAILDSGCDTAHDDLGDIQQDNEDGPPPAVGDADDWWPAADGWIFTQGYKVFGWHDVTDDFPEAVGPWDYHNHGTALAGVVAGTGNVDPAYHGVAPAARLTIVKFYDFDGIWHQWAFDFLAACDWVLANHELHRIRVLLAAVNWEVDAGISDALEAIAALGILPVVAAGNHGSNGSGPWYPASVPAALTVGAVNDAGQIAAFSGRGSSGNDKPDLVAPGGGLLPEAGRIVTTDNEPNDSYSGRYGTSLAAAHVAGAAYLLLEALRKEGHAAVSDAQGLGEVRALLKSTAAAVFWAEDSSGTGSLAVNGAPFPNATTGWGLLQIPAAAQAALEPLIAPGSGESDTLSVAARRQSAARRLVTEPGSRYRITATPTGDLDIQLEFHNTCWYIDENLARSPIRTDRYGAGMAESLAQRGEAGGFSYVVAKRLGGAGEVTFSMVEIEPATDTGFTLLAEGALSGWPNSGRVAGTATTALVFCSDVVFDPDARSINVVDPDGNAPPGWPAFVFLSEDLRGSLSAPLVWDLDGADGDEVVVASDFGMLYFVGSFGSVTEAELVVNRGLTAPVGVIGSGGQRSVLVVDDVGIVSRYDDDAQWQGSTFLEHDNPRAPAVGQLVAGAAEEIVIAFPDGEVFVLDATGGILSGWPVDLGVNLSVAPVLIDLDADGYHEIYLPVLTPGVGVLTVRALLGNGQSAPLDGSIMPAPGGGKWLSISDPAAAGGYFGGDVRLTVAGVTSVDAGEETECWSLALARLTTGGALAADPNPHFAVEITSPSGVLDLRWICLPPPLAWNFTGYGAADSEIFAALGWQETISGSLDRYGATTAFFRSAAADGERYRPRSWRRGGCLAAPVQFASTCVFPLPDYAEERRWARVLCLDDTVRLQQTGADAGPAASWRAARGDGRNSGAYPLRDYDPTAVAATTPAGGPQLRLWPNPTGGSCQVAWRNLTATAATLEVYDVRGRRLRRFDTADLSDGLLVWDGCDRNNRPVPAGTYLFVLRAGPDTIRSRVILHR